MTTIMKAIKSLPGLKITDFEDRSLLIVDDDDPLRMRLSRAMEKKGFTVKSAKTLGESVQLLKQNPPTFAVIDLRLDDGSGLDVVKELFRAKKDIPSNEIFEKWCNGKRIEGHLAIICAYNMMKSNHKISDDIISKLSSIPVYRRDSILSRVKDEVTLKKNKQDVV